MEIPAGFESKISEQSSCVPTHRPPSMPTDPIRDGGGTVPPEMLQKVVQVQCTEPLEVTDGAAVTQLRDWC